MSVDSLTYLLGIYWPYLTGALVVGLATGWLTYPRPGK